MSEHFTPKGRVKNDYIERLIANPLCSNVLLHYLTGRWKIPNRPSMLRRLSLRRYECSLGLPERRACHVERRDRLHAAEIIAEIEQGNREVRQTL